MSTKTKKVYHVRKSAPKHPSPLQLPPQHQPLVQDLPSEINSLVNGPQLTVDTLTLSFSTQLNCIQLHGVTVKNIGSSAVFLRWQFKNTPKINPTAIKDAKSKFKLHYERSVIKPQQQFTFIFSFLSEIPGNFTEEVELECQPPLITPIPSLKLSGCATISDDEKPSRTAFLAKLQEHCLKESVRATLTDLIQEVRLPPPPLPDVSIPAIAQQQFTLHNRTRNVHFNTMIHRWFTELHEEVMRRKNVLHPYWDQSVDSLKREIESLPEFKAEEGDEYCLQYASMQSLLDRLEHYCHLSRSKAPERSPLYRTIYQFVSNAAYKLGGDFVDGVRKEMDMWEVPFREPLETDTPEDQKSRKEEIQKIKAQWVKKSKKKKWGEEEEKQVLNQYRKKLVFRTSQQILNSFYQFQDKAQYIRMKHILAQTPFNRTQYNEFLSRMKTVKQYPLQGQKVLFKLKIKLKKNCQSELLSLQQYIRRRREGESDKKKGGKKKKKQQEIKPFDWTSILQEQNWLGIIQTLKTILQKSPSLLILFCSFDPFCDDPQLQSVSFLLEYLKSVEPTMEYMSFSSLCQLHKHPDTVADGSILLTDNKLVGENIGAILHNEIRSGLEAVEAVVDVVVSEDVESVSALLNYIRRPCILGCLAWKYIALSMRVHPSTCIVSGAFTPQMYFFLARMSGQRVALVGEVGRVFYLVQKGQGGAVSPHVAPYVTEIIQMYKDTLIVPVDWEGEFADVGEHSLQSLYEINKGNVFVLGDTGVKQNQGEISGSMSKLLKQKYAVQNEKRRRHREEAVGGINYQEDLVLYLVEVNKGAVEKNLFKEEEEEEEEEKTIDKVADFVLDNKSYLMRLMMGQYQEPLKNIARYPKSVQE